MKFGQISIAKNNNAFISGQPISEIPRKETDIQLLPAVVAPPPRDDAPFQTRLPKAARRASFLALLALAIGLTHRASATPLNSIISAPNSSPTSINLAWDPSPGTNVAGYAVYYGTASREYTSRVDVGANLSFTVNGLDPTQTYYFTANAYDSSGDESDFSNEIVVSADGTSDPPIPTTNIVTVTVPVLSSTNPTGPWQVEAMCTLTYTNPSGNKFFMPGRLSISNLLQ